MKGFVFFVIKVWIYFDIEKLEGIEVEGFGNVYGEMWVWKFIGINSEIIVWILMNV